VLSLLAARALALKDARIRGLDEAVSTFRSAA
jgi:hypothetical protein